MDLPNFPANRGPGPCRKISQRRGSAAVRAESMSRASRHVARFHERTTRTKSSLFSGCQISFPRWFWFLGGFFGGFKKKSDPSWEDSGRSWLDHLGPPRESTLVTWKSGNWIHHIGLLIPSLQIVAVVVASYIKSTLCHHAHDLGVAQGHVDTGTSWKLWNSWGESVAQHGWPKTLSWFEDRDGENSCQMSNAPELQWMKMVAS